MLDYRSVRVPPNCFYVHLIWGRFPIWRAYFSIGLVQPATRKWPNISVTKYHVTGSTLGPIRPAAHFQVQTNGESIWDHSTSSEAEGGSVGTHGTLLRFTYLDVRWEEVDGSKVSDQWVISPTYKWGVCIYIYINGYNHQGYSKWWALEKVTPFKQISGSLKTI